MATIGMRKDSIFNLKFNNMETEAKPKQVQAPTVGRIVHFIPGSNFSATSLNGATVLPAIVVQTWDNLIANLTIFVPGGDTVAGFSVIHESQNHELNTTGYWKWPDRV